MSRRGLLILLVVTLITAGCGDDGGEATTTSGVPQAPAELRFTFEDISGSEGMLLVATVTSGGQLVGTVCLPVAADPFSGMGVVRSSAPDNPCGYDSPHGIPLTSEGEYTYMVATYFPGSQTPGLCATGEVTLAGPTEVVLAGDDFTVGCTA